MLTRSPASFRRTQAFLQISTFGAGEKKIFMLQVRVHLLHRLKQSKVGRVGGFVVICSLASIISSTSSSHGIMERLRLERTLKPTWSQPPAVGWLPPPAQAAQGLTPPGLEHLQGGGTHSFLGSWHHCLITLWVSQWRWAGFSSPEQYTAQCSQSSPGSREIAQCLHFCF